MTKKELELFSQIDDFCNEHLFSYVVKSTPQLGVIITINLTKSHTLRFGGIDNNLENALEKALEFLKQLKITNSYDSTP